MPGEYNDPTARGDGAEVSGWRLQLIKTQRLALGGDEDLIAGDEGPREVPGAASVLPAPQPLGIQGPYDVQEEDGGLWTTIRVPEPGVGDETLLCQPMCACSVLS